MPAPSAITPAQLLRLVGTPDCPVLVDLRTPEDTAEDPHIVPGAIRHPHDRLADLISRLGGRPSVAICQKGRKLSQGLAAWLRAEGLAAEYLEGGTYGWRALPGAPRLPLDAIPMRPNGAPAGAGTLWVTRHRPKIDRIACPWLIRRFVDRNARILFVAPGEVDAVAERFGATPFDVEGCALTHRGEGCTFDSMIERFGLATEPLARLATVVRAADTNRHALAPEAAGLLAISVGLSRQYRDDTAQLEAGMTIYDALYRWARDGHDEGHDSRPGGRR